MRCAAVIVAGGQGRRFGGERPKQFELLSGRPVLVWTIEAFERVSAIDAIVLVIPEGLRGDTEQVLAEYGKQDRVVLCHGGAERFDSVRNGLDAIPPESDLVAIHDAVRPLVSDGLIQRVVAAADANGAAIAALGATDTIKLGEEGTITDTIERGRVFLAQTPQVFRVSVLREAFVAWEKAGKPPVTDDAQLVAAAGHAVDLVAGERNNIKITVPDDLVFAEALLAQEQIDLRVPRTGIGYDVHRLVSGRPLILGGITIAHEKGLDGHSDADVLAHAISDALLGAAALGDIGQHFPPSDAQYKNADSLKLLERVAQLTEQAGFSIANIDSVIVCQLPKLAPHIPGMRERLAQALQLPVDRVSVKATTTEGLGAAGRQEGIAATATAMLVPTTLVPRR